MFDSPVLRHYVATRGKGRIDLLGATFRPEPYGIALPTGSPLRERIDSTLLAITADGTYAQISARCFGADG